MRLGPTELLIILAVVLLLFGAGRLPKLARSMREAREELEKSKAGEDAKDEEKQS